MHSQDRRPPYEFDDDDNENFETFIANRRRNRHGDSPQNMNTQQQEDDTALYKVPPLLNVSSHATNENLANLTGGTPWNSSTLEERTSVREAEAVATRDAVDVARSKSQARLDTQVLSTYRGSLSRTKGPDWPIRSDRLNSPTSLRARASTQSPLFVEQTVSPISYARASHTPSTSRLLPIDYDSEEEKMVPTQLNFYSDKLPARESGKKIVMMHPFTVIDAAPQSRLVNNTRDSSSASEIFNRQDLSERERMEKVERELRFGKNNHKARAASDKSLESSSTRKRKVSSISTYTNKRINVDQHSPAHTQMGSSKLSSATDQEDNSASLSSGVSRTTAPNLQRTAETTNLDVATTPMVPPMFSGHHGLESTSPLPDFLLSQINKYEQCLMKIGYPHVKDDQHWQQLEAQIQPGVEYLVQNLQMDQESNKEVFKMNLQAWDLDIGARAILQKYLVYSALLKRVSET